MFDFLFAVIRKGTFSKFDYGPLGNEEKYGTSVAPLYNVSNIPKDFLMLLAHGGKDTISVPIDVQRLLTKLSCRTKHVYIEPYSHFDFVIGTKAKIDLYDNLIAFFNSRRL